MWEWIVGIWNSLTWTDLSFVAVPAFLFALFWLFVVDDK